MDAPAARKQRTTTSERIDPNKPAAIVINGHFNGLTHFCKLTGYATSTGHWWLTRGYIPAQRKGESIHAHILAVAKANDIDLPPEAFVQTAVQAANV